MWYELKSYIAKYFAGGGEGYKTSWSFDGSAVQNGRQNCV
jgi:hypothetical protein